MVNIIFEDSFEGFLSALYWAFSNNIKNPIFLKAKKPSLFKNVKVEKDPNVIKTLNKIMDEDTIDMFYDAFCFDEEQAFVNIYKGFLFYMEHKHLKDIHKDFIRNINSYIKSVRRERHKYIGFLRFHQVDNILYAQFEPKHFVLDYVGAFFKERYKKENFIIHDIKRKKAAIYDKENLDISFFEKTIDITKDKYQELWKTFFEAVAIEQRTNERLQNHYAPKYFRKYMIEFSD